MGLVLLQRKVPGRLRTGVLFGSISRTLIASVVMGFIVWSVYQQWLVLITVGHGTLDELMRILFAAAIGTISYFALAWILRARELYEAVDFSRELVHGIARRLARS